MADGQASLEALVNNGVLAYKNREFKHAIDNLQKVLDADPRHWRAKLYLAMSYYHGGEVFTAFRHFRFLEENCTDPDIRDKAAAALRAMNDQMADQKAMPDMTCTMKKPTPSQGFPVSKVQDQDKASTTYDIDVTAADDDLESEWEKTRVERP